MHIHKNLNINNLNGEGDFQSSLLIKTIYTGLKQTGRVSSLAMMLCLSAFFVYIPLDASAQMRIQMEREGSLYKIPCYVNGAKMKMLLDTGASNVSISLAMAQYLYENDYINDDDILGTAQTIIADGSIVDNTVINIRELSIDTIYITDVKAVVSKSLTAPLLLGQSALEKLGSYTIDGDILILNDFYTDLNTYNEDEHFDEDENERILKLALDNKDYYKMFECLQEKEKYKTLGMFDLFDMTHCSSILGKNMMSIKYGEEFLRLFEYSEDIDRRLLLSIYNTLGQNYSQIEDYDKYLVYANKLLNHSQSTEEEAEAYLAISDAYYKKNEFYNAIYYCTKAIDKQISYLFVDMNKINKNEVNDEILSFLYSRLGLLHLMTGNETLSNNCRILAAKCGDLDSINDLTEEGIDYKKIKLKQ